MSSERPEIALIDDDKNYLRIMELSLGEAFRLSTFHEPLKAIKALSGNAPDAVLLDLHMEEVDGFDVCKLIKTKWPSLPVFFLTSDPALEKIDQGFRCGGIDYFSKSITPQELITRIKGRLQGPKNRTLLQCRNIFLDPVAREVKIGEKVVNLTPKEFDIVHIFIEHQDEVLSKKRILEFLWKDVYVDANNVDTHMFHIRKKFGRTTGIECRKGLGYVLRSKL